MNRNCILRSLYLVALLTCIGWTIACPTWVGRTYWPSHQDPNTLEARGGFGLDRDRSPVWNPPQPSGARGDVDVRWPWQSATKGDSIEVNILMMTAEIMLACIGLGLVLGGLHHFCSREPDVVLQIAWSSGLSLMLGFLFLFVLVVMSAGFGPPESVSYSTVALTALFGVVHGLRSYRTGRQVAAEAKEVGDQSKPDAAKSTPTIRGDQIGQQPGSALLWFAGGMLCAMGIMLLAGNIAAFFRGPIAGVTVLGTTRYVHDQTPVDLTTGIAILASGWGVAVVCLRKWCLRSFGWGLIAGTTLAGIAFACWK
jgi:hypothetical protein